MPGALDLELNNDHTHLKAMWEHLHMSVPNTTIYQSYAWYSAWKASNPEVDTLIVSLQIDSECVGLVPLLRMDHGWTIAGGEEIADFLDILVLPGYERAMAEAVVKLFLETRSAEDQLDIPNLIPSSVVLAHVPNILNSYCIPFSIVEIDLKSTIALPASSQQYLDMLGRKTRRQLRNGYRKLLQFPSYTFQMKSSHAICDEQLDCFFRLMSQSSDDKRGFLQNGMQLQLHTIFQHVREYTWLRMGCTYLEERLVAAHICFDFRHQRYIYNSAYDTRLAKLSLGSQNLYRCILDAIESGMQICQLLQGREQYKSRFGASADRIFRLRTAL